MKGVLAVPTVMQSWACVCATGGAGKDEGGQRARVRHGHQAQPGRPARPDYAGAALIWHPAHVITVPAHLHRHGSSQILGLLTATLRLMGSYARLEQVEVTRDLKNNFVLVHSAPASK